VAGCKPHSDRGGQVRSRKLQQSLWRHQMIGSMGHVCQPEATPPWRASSACSNATSSTAAKWTDREGLRVAIVTWIERTYPRRRYAHLRRLTPIEYEVTLTELANQAAELIVTD
jgi:putative transposase